MSTEYNKIAFVMRKNPEYMQYLISDNRGDMYGELAVLWA